MAKGTGWTVGTQLIIQAIAMLSTMMLARLLVPADFGLVALATALSGALTAVTELLGSHRVWERFAPVST